jgi:hypothetical protein
MDLVVGAGSHWLVPIAGFRGSNGLLAHFFLPLQALILPLTQFQAYFPDKVMLFGRQKGTLSAVLAAPIRTNTADERSLRRW